MKKSASGKKIQDARSYEEDIKQFPKFGITMAGIREFIKTSGGASAVNTMTGYDICDKFIKPATQASKNSYCDMLAAKKSPHVKAANIYVIHAWKFNFANAIDNLEYHFKSANTDGKIKLEDAVFWFDLFSNNQNNSGVTPPATWFSGALYRSVEKIGRSVMILESGLNLFTLQRIWCLWEVYSTVATNCT